MTNQCVFVSFCWHEAQDVCCNAAVWFVCGTTSPFQPFWSNSGTLSLVSHQSDCLVMCSHTSQTVWYCALTPVRLSGTVLSYQSDCLVLCSHTSWTVWYCALIPVGLSGTVLSYQSDCLVLCSHVRPSLYHALQTQRQSWIFFSNLKVLLEMDSYILVTWVSSFWKGFLTLTNPMSYRKWVTNLAYSRWRMAGTVLSHQSDCLVLCTCTSRTVLY